MKNKNSLNRFLFKRFPRKLTRRKSTVEWNFIWDKQPAEGQYIIYLFPVFNRIFVGRYTRLTPTDDIPWEHLIISIDGSGFLQDEDVYWIPMPGFGKKYYYDSIQDLQTKIFKQKEERRVFDNITRAARQREQQLLARYIAKYGAIDDDWSIKDDQLC